MDVRAKQRLCYLACLFNLNGLGGGFAPRHLSRYIASLEIEVRTMKIKIIGIIFLVLAFSSVRAQTLSEIEKKFGAPVKSYSVSENIWMSPEFTDDGQLCMARLYPKKIDATTNYVNDSFLSLWEVKEVFDDLAPVVVRGQKKEDFGMLISGNMIFSGFKYENVQINFISAFGFASNLASANKRRLAEIAEFPKVSAPQIVTISWLNRKCANP